MNKGLINALIQSKAQKEPELAEVLRQMSDEIVALQEEVSSLVLENSDSLFGKDRVGKLVKLITVDGNNSIRLGDKERAKSTGEFHLFITVVDRTSNLPTTADHGLILIDSQTSDLVFYAGGLRYRANKTAF